MKNLPVPVPDLDIDEMFEFADKNHDGKLSYAEFEVLLWNLLL
jgi:Ca2+-binding EF-hand superfamily protein